MDWGIGVLGIWVTRIEKREEVTATRLTAQPATSAHTHKEMLSYAQACKGWVWAIEWALRFVWVVECLLCIHHISSLRSPKETLAVSEDEERKKISEKEAMSTDDLPEAIIEEILSRLPVKSLIRFRCVCKHWCALVADPAFVKMHLARYSASNSNLSLIVFNKSYSRDSYLYSVDLDAFRQRAAVELKSPYHATQVVGSCNGLVCILSDYRNALFELQNPSIRIFIWNPSIRRHQMLPVTPIEYPSKFSRLQKIFYGFGHDPTTDDYKLVRVVQFDGAWDSEVKVYSLSTNSWRRIADLPFDLFHITKFGVLANSALHWVANRQKGSYSFDAPRFIVSFDLKDEEYRKVPLPDFTDDKFQLNVGVLGEQLCALCKFFKVRFEIWVMKDYGVRDSWVKQFSIETPLVIKFSFQYFRPICYLKNGEVILEKNSRSLILYDPLQDKSRYIRIPSVPDRRRRYGIPSISAETYVGSVVPLNARDGTEQ